MNIVDIRNKNTNFINLKEGEIAYEPKRRAYIIKIVPIWCEEDKLTYNAIDLRDGNAIAMESADEVICVTGTLTIEGA